MDSRLPAETRAAAVARMCAAMRHRGPDAEGGVSRGEATFGMRRLAVFDPANGAQPMSSPDGRFTLVFNGAVYNFRALRRELAGGWDFRTDCDTEVLLAAFARWGAASVQRLRGMFAFAAWDDRERRLFLARDPFGIKPLYLRHDGAGLIFASELNALRAAGTFAIETDPAAVADYLSWLAVPAPRTIYRGVISLRPGETATFAGGRLTIDRAWDFRPAADGAARCATRAEFVRELRLRLKDTVRAHQAADVPVGAFLSGGLDSTAIVALMARTSGTRLRTFSIGFAEADYSEAAAAEAAARELGVEHTTLVLSGARVAANLEPLLAALDQPTGDAINTFYASAAARAGGVTVALSGVGGDELFGGYPSFRDLPRLARWLPLWRRTPAGARAAVTARLHRGDTRRRKLADFLAEAGSLHELAALQRRVFANGARQSLLAPELGRTETGRGAFHPELDRLRDELGDAPAPDVISAWELRTYMADVLLRDSDTMSMRHSLELRVPFVDRPLIEWLRAQPAEFRFTPQQPKSALAAALADVLPAGTATRPKRGFTLPFAIWMRRELRPFLEETFTTASIARTGCLQPAAVQQRWRDYLAGRDPREWSRIWSLAVLIAFLNRR